MAKFGKNFAQRIAANASKNLAGKIAKSQQNKKKPKGGGSHR